MAEADNRYLSNICVLSSGIGVFEVTVALPALRKSRELPGFEGAVNCHLENSKT